MSGGISTAAAATEGARNLIIPCGDVPSATKLDPPPSKKRIILRQELMLEGPLTHPCYIVSHLFQCVWTLQQIVTLATHLLHYVTLCYNCYTMCYTVLHFVTLVTQCYAHANQSPVENTCLEPWLSVSPLFQSFPTLIILPQCPAQKPPTLQLCLCRPKV